MGSLHLSLQNKIFYCLYFINHWLVSYLDQASNFVVGEMNGYTKIYWNKLYAISKEFQEAVTIKEKFPLPRNSDLTFIMSGIFFSR